MNRSELVLQYVKTLIWPLIVVLILFAFREQVASLLGGEIEAEIFGVKIKGKKISGIEQLEKQANELKEALAVSRAEFTKLQDTNRNLLLANEQMRKSMEEQNQQIEKAKTTGNMALVKPTDTPVEKGQNLAARSEKLTSSIQAQLDKAQSIVKGKDLDGAKRYELMGFEQLVNDQFEDSITSFEMAYAAYPDYHNVDEIRRLLRRNQDALRSPSLRDSAKREVFKQILGEFSWGIPKDVEKKMKDYLAS